MQNFSSIRIISMFCSQKALNKQSVICANYVSKQVLNGTANRMIRFMYHLHTTATATFVASSSQFAQKILCPFNVFVSKTNRSFWWS